VKILSFVCPVQANRTKGVSRKESSDCVVTGNKKKDDSGEGQFVVLA
jgi:hypothetical protein